MLIRELLDRGRRVFVRLSGFPDGLLSRVLEGWILSPLPGTDLMEVGGAPASTPRR
jgi:hypothetical protein